MAAARSMATGLAPRTLLLAHHGTPGAEQAAALALSLAVPGHTRIVHLYVVPDFWDGMQGDDWLNNAWTRDAFGRHVESQLESDAREQMRGVAERCAAQGIECEQILRYGKPADCLLAAARECGADVEPERLASIFTPFFLRPENPQYVSINLATSYVTLCSLGGWAMASNEPERGTVITLCLPVVPPGRSSDSRQINAWDRVLGAAD